MTQETVSTIHVVFKTHLDIGFTDLPHRVVDRYLSDYLPRAIDLADELEARGGQARFVWTTGSWLIAHALRSYQGTALQRLENTIRAGKVRWHGLPMTTHSELLDRSLFDFGISIGRRLDERFGVTTIAGKMTDVPGHTIGIVPALEDAGIRYLHLGVNPASAVPDVPEFFRWQAPDGSEVVVNYAHNYGATSHEVAVPAGSRDGLYFAFTGDNHGPPSADDIEELFAALAAEHPGANIVASSLDEFARSVLAVSDGLPVVTAEIGDSWIYGAASDPLLTGSLRRLLDLRTRWQGSGELLPGSAEDDGFAEALLLIAEHTWGEDLKSYLPDFGHYTKELFTLARGNDIVDLTQNPEWIRELVRGDGEPNRRREFRYSGYEESWAAKRGYLDAAVAALAPERRAAANAALRDLDHPAPTPTSTAVRVVEVADELRIGSWRVRFGRDGSIVSLVSADDVQWAGSDNRLGAFRYQTFDERDEALWLQEYVRDLEHHGLWAIPDFTKPGLEIADRHPARVFEPELVSATRRDDGDAVTVELSLVLPEDAVTVWGAPRTIRVGYRFPAAGGTIEITLELLDRSASRLPEASWFGFRPRTEDGQWRMSKLGTAVDPLHVVAGGNRAMHAVAAVSHLGRRPFVLRTHDAPVVAVGTPQLYRFTNAVARPDDGWNVNLHNNVWGTNFRMWFDDDLRHRFTLEFG